MHKHVPAIVDITTGKDQHHFIYFVGKLCESLFISLISLIDFSDFTNFNWGFLESSETSQTVKKAVHLPMHRKTEAKAGFSSDTDDWNALVHIAFEPSMWMQLAETELSKSLCGLSLPTAM